MLPCSSARRPSVKQALRISPRRNISRRVPRAARSALGWRLNGSQRPDASDKEFVPRGPGWSGSTRGSNWDRSASPVADLGLAAAARIGLVGLRFPELHEAAWPVPALAVPERHPRQWQAAFRSNLRARSEAGRPSRPVPYGAYSGPKEPWIRSRTSLEVSTISPDHTSRSPGFDPGPCHKAFERASHLRSTPQAGSRNLSAPVPRV